MKLLLILHLGELYSEQGEVTKALNAYETVLKEENEISWS